jgi:hypothetical protein
MLQVQAAAIPLPTDSTEDARTAGSPDPATCTIRVLRELGWQVERGDASSLRIDAGQACTRADQADARAQGDLQLLVPGKMAVTPALLEQLASHPASHCAYAMRLGESTRVAVDALVANPSFRFSALQTGWIGFGSGGARRDGWEPMRSFGRAFRPLASPSQAIQGFYRGSVRAECGVGRQIAQYGSVHELFGTHGFDAAFSRDEIVIGTFRQLNRSGSVLLGSAAGRFIHDGDGQQAAAQGRQAWSGLPGFIVHVFERHTLDDVNNQAENFVVYRVSDAAAKALQAHGGFAHYNRQAHALWELARRSELSAQRIFERLLHERDSRLRSAISPRNRSLIEQMDAILADPFFQGFEIYVHPKGVKPVAYHFARLLDRNPRTPFRIELALHNLHTTIYDRWLAQRFEACTGP